MSAILRSVTTKCAIWIRPAKKTPTSMTWAAVRHMRTCKSENMCRSVERFSDREIRGNERYGYIDQNGFGQRKLKAKNKESRYENIKEVSTECHVLLMQGYVNRMYRVSAASAGKFLNDKSPIRRRALVWMLCSGIHPSRDPSSRFVNSSRKMWARDVIFLL